MRVAVIFEHALNAIEDGEWLVGVSWQGGGWVEGERWRFVVDKKHRMWSIGAGCSVGDREFEGTATHKEFANRIDQRHGRPSERGVRDGIASHSGRRCMVHRRMSRLSPISRRLNRPTLALVAMLGVAACETQLDPPPSAGLRIASFSPAMTSMVIDLGLEAHLVGRTPYCRGVAAGVPVVGSLETLDAEMLLRIAPTVVLVQPSVVGVDPSLRGLATQHNFALVAEQLDGIDDIVRAVDAIALACTSVSVDGARDHQVALLRAMRREVAPNAPRVLVLYSIDPLGAVGRGTYLDQVLIAAGGVNAVAREGWLELSPEELVHLEPEVVVVIGMDGASLEALPWNDPPRVVLFDEPDALEPSARAPRVAASLRSLLLGASP